MSATTSTSGSEAATDRILRDLGQTQICSDRPLLSQGEDRVLELYSQIREVRLQRAVIEAAAEFPAVVSQPEGPGPISEKLQQELQQAENELVEARAVHLIQQHVVNDVLAMDPTLRAVHALPLADSRERDLLRLIDQRDILALTHENITSDVRAVQDQLLAIQVKSLKAVEENQKLAHDLRVVAAELRSKDATTAQDEQLRDELAAVEADVARARRRRQLVKEVISAIVAGSGIDWSQDERLLKLVLEEGT